MCERLSGKTNTKERLIAKKLYQSQKLNALIDLMKYVSEINCLF